MRWVTETATCARAHWPLKAKLSLCLTILFAAPYFTLQHIELLRVHTFELTWLDRAIGFEPGWVWAYQSVYLLVAVVPWVTAREADLMRYTRGFVLLSSIGFACFVFYPVAGPRPDIVPSPDMFGWLVWYDRPTNAFPSLHVGLAAYSVLFATQRARVARSPSPGWVAAAGAAWVAIIGYAAIATKQHYVGDLPAGLGAALTAHYWTWRVAVAPAEAHADSAVLLRRDRA